MIPVVAAKKLRKFDPKKFLSTAADVILRQEPDEEEDEEGDEGDGKEKEDDDDDDTTYDGYSE